MSSIHPTTSALILPRKSILTSLLLASFTPLQGGVVAHYRFDTDFSDSSGNGNHGTLNDVDTSGNTAITSASVFGAGSIDFSDDPDTVIIPTQSFASGSSYAVSFWAQVDSASREWNIATGQAGGATHFLALNGLSDMVRWRGNSGHQVDYVTGVNDTAWHHYVLNSDGTNMSLYLDGNLVSSSSPADRSFIVDSIGYAYPTTNDFDFQGRIDEMWIFDESLDSTAVSNLYNFNSPIPEPSSLIFSGLSLLAGCLLRKRS